MNSVHEYMNDLLKELIELLDIPPSYYEEAADRYRSLGKWFHREDSVLAPFDPQVYPQGSFRYGTVIRPLGRWEEYDLDLVCQLTLLKANLTQKKLKELVGIEVTSYAEAHKFNEPADEKRRCWRLNYADEVSFHMDILPAVPDDQDFIRLLVAAGVPAELAAHAIAITDTGHPNYSVIDVDWPRSNPKGFAKWFEGRIRAVSQARRRKLVENRAYATVDDVPTYEWKTPLQRSIQLLKRHRDVMYQDAPDLKPISMIITTLSAKAYQGESDMYLALSGILDRMPQFVMPTAPRVPNPVNPAEDFADRWSENPRLEESFWQWHRQAKADFASIQSLTGSQLEHLIRKRFELDYLTRTRAQPAGVAAASIPAIHIKPSRGDIKAPPSPWAS